MRVVLLSGKSNNSSKAGVFNVNSNNTFSNNNSNIFWFIVAAIIGYFIDKRNRRR